MPMTPADELLTSAEACRLLGIHPSTLSRRVKRGELIPVKKHAGLRGPMLFAREDVERVSASAA